MATHNIALFNRWLAKHADLALDAANHLQPIWSQPRVKVATFSDALGHAKNRIKGIASRARPESSAPISHPNPTAVPQLQPSGDSTCCTKHDNIFKSMKDITFEDTISHQCGVTMNDSVEARAIADVMSRQDRYHGDLHAGDDPHRRRRQDGIQDGRDLARSWVA